MLTLKLYAADGFRQRIIEAESLTVLRNGAVEITAHGVRVQGELTDQRFDLPSPDVAPTIEPDIWWEMAIVENMTGKTTEIIRPGDPHRYQASPTNILPRV